jgi:hypothetical protein
MAEATLAWRRCSSCKRPIPYRSLYWVCNVSTCNRRNTSFVFCSIDCWEVHLPTMNHRESWAEERFSPSREEAERARAAAPREAPRRDLARPAAPPARPAAPAPPAARSAPKEILIVASRLKDYIRARSDMNTSERVLEPLSEIVREVCERAIENARRDGRKTVLDRDVPRR